MFAPDGAGEHPEKPVPDGVSVPVVELLEIVHVHDEEGEGSFVPFRALDLRGEPIKEVRAIVQGGEVVLDDELLELLLPVEDRLHQIDADGGHAHVGHRHPRPLRRLVREGLLEGEVFERHVHGRDDPVEFELKQPPVRQGSPQGEGEGVRGLLHHQDRFEGHDQVHRPEPRHRPPAVMDHDRHEQQVEEQLDLVEGADVGERLVEVQEEGVIDRHGAPGEDREDDLEGVERTEVDGIVVEDGVGDDPVRRQDPEDDPARLNDLGDPDPGFVQQCQFIGGWSIGGNILQPRKIHILSPTGIFSSISAKNGKYSILRPMGWD